MENGLSGQLRSVISLVDRLRDISLESYIQLPKVVVVGSQSSGKSSLIEQIVGLDFLPRGSGVVTRRPLEIRMVYQPSLSQPFAVFQEIPNKRFSDFLKVKEAIEQVTDKVCGTNKNIVDKAIILSIHSRNCPNLTVIDLPGLTRIALDGQSAHIYGITTDMIKKYMKDPTSIILCVVPANQDITNDEVLSYALQIDPIGERTIGCVTKIDLMDRGTDARDTLLNKSEVPLKLGYVGIKNRSQEDINMKKTVAEGLQEEKMYFSKNPIYSTLPQRCLGTNALVTSLTSVLQSNIMQFLPELMDQVKQRKTALHQLIKEYGKPLPKTEQEAQAMLWSICNHFLVEFKKTVKGHLTSLRCRETLSKNSAQINIHLGEVLLLELNEPLAEGLTSQRIHFSIMKYEGSNMPGFPSINSFYFLIDPLLRKLKHPLMHCLEEVSFLLSHVAEEIMSQVAREFPNFREHIFERITRIVEQSKRKCSKFIEDLIEAEVGYIYTNNTEFYEMMHQHNHIYSDPKDELARKHPMITELKKRVNIYYKLTVKNLREIIPRNIKNIMIDKTARNIEFEIFQACIGEKEKVQEWLKLNSHEKQERVKKEKEYDVICKAESFLLTHKTFSKVRVEDIKRKKIEREKQLKAVRSQAKKRNMEQSPIKKETKPELPKESARKPNYEDNKVEEKKQQSKQQEKNVQAVKQPEKNVDQKKTNVQPPPEKKKLLDNLFGLGANKKQQLQPKKESPKEPQISKQQQLKNQYNQKAGQATDKAVDEMFKNETFKKQSTKAVEKGTSAAIQKQFGTSEESANFLGKGAGWMFKQDVTQNYLKEQTKANVKDQVQIKK